MLKLLQMMEYNFWANDLFINRLKEYAPLPEDIHAQVSHLLNAHMIWLQRCSAGGKTETSLWGDTDCDEWEAINLRLFHDTSGLLKSTDINRKFSYENSSGEIFEHSFGDIINHLLIHSAHHRAQITLLMRQNHILPPQSDYIFYLRR